MTTTFTQHVESIREDLRTQTDPAVRNLGEAIVEGYDRARAGRGDERLLKLREAVVNAPVKRFNMEYMACGTSACGAGHYVIANPDCGLKLLWTSDSDRAALVPSGLAEGDDSVHSPIDLLADHFGITPSESGDLFFTWCGATRAEQKYGFLAKLDALLLARGLAAPAAARAGEGAGT